MDEKQRSAAPPRFEQHVDPWFEKVYNENYAVVYRYAKLLVRVHDGILAEETNDLVQETFFILYNKREKLYTHVNITGWLIVALRYHYANRRRKWVRHNRNRVHMQNLENAPDPRSVEEHAFPTDPKILELFRSILGDKKYNDLANHYLHKIPIRELALAQGKNPNALRVQMYRSRIALRKYMSEHKDILLLIFIIHVIFSDLTT